MKYVGLQKQINTNNRKSVALILAFPVLLLVMVFVFFVIVNIDKYDQLGWQLSTVLLDFAVVVPIVLLVVGIWFVIAYFGNTKMIAFASNSKSLSRVENPRVYNLVENLCMSVGMKVPKIQIIESEALNAFASGINEKTYTVTLTRGIIEKLNDEELEGVIAHELVHIRNHDVKLLIVSIIFVGIFSFLMQISYRVFLSSAMGASSRRKNDDKGGTAILMLVIFLLSIIAYFLSFLFKLSLSRKREYLADAGAAEMTKKPLALAGALAKIAGNSHIENVKGADIEQMYIHHEPKSAFAGVKSLFSTHPPIEKRIQFLRQM